SVTYDGSPTGTPPTSGFRLTTYLSTGGVGAGKQPDIGQQFNPGNYAFHPLFQIGLNQPPTNANANWASSAGRRHASSTYPGGDGVNQAYATAIAPAGLDNTFVNGWGTKSLVVCTDCHESSDTSVDGPHGSAQQWILRKAESRTVKIADGSTVTLNTGTQLSGVQAGDDRAANAFCLNCHRADVYGNGRGDYNGIAATYANLSRFDHSFNPSSTPDSKCMGSGNNVLYGDPYKSPSCLGCHGGREPGGIHGSKMTTSGASGGADPQGKRFMNGANWGSHTLTGGASNNSPGCYTVNIDAVSACGHSHSGTTSNGTLYYTY
ncbi:MAG TPA: hypothetical protein VNU93_05150, partial [Verrucomicrobiae bacterium]|nr:hypothetical protein [Verrucomicrobiae bacterium]